MSDITVPASAGRTPWHFWIVAILALLWNGFGAYDYVMTTTQNAAWFETMGVTPEMAAYYEGLPVWHVGVWAIGVWAAVLASLCLLIRKAWAVWLFAISLIAMIVGNGVTLMDAETRAMAGQIGLIMIGVVFVIGVFELAYSVAMKKRGVLR